MAAVAERQQSEREFVGHVFSRPSPILTWRPVKVQRITMAAANGADRPSDAASNHYASRAPTKRIVAWPVVRNIGHGPGYGTGRALRALLTLMGLSLLCGSALAIGVYLILGDGSIALHPSTAATANVEVAALHAGLPSRVARPHLFAREGVDTLAPAPVPVVATAVVPHPAAPLSAPAHRGRAHRGHHDGGSPLHAFHAPPGSAGGAREARPSRRAT
jgi:hypothetical protein